ncbi:MAG: TonB-dependent receptor [Rhodospirillaceae bacterium]|nr:TonB-dependent receptor [Rhodospirillaceae bacterium]
MLKQTLLRTASGCSLALLASTTPEGTALAQQQQSQQFTLEEIVVTARRIEENLMQVPLAISAMSASDIQNTGVTTLNELVKFTPGLISTPGMNTGRIGGPVGRSGANLIFRGLSVATGLTFIDGAPYAGGSTPDITDVARVEVLKGPQSIYFGRSTYSGAVNYVSKEPADAFGGSVAGDISSYNGIDTRATIEGPINNIFSYRISGRHFSTDGQYENPLKSDRLGWQHTNSVNVYVMARPTDELKVSGLYTWSMNNDGAPAEGVMVARVFVPTGNPAIIDSPLRGGELNCEVGGTGGPWWCGELPNARTLVSKNPVFFSVHNALDGLAIYRLFDNPPLPIGQLGGALASYPMPFDTRWLKHFGFKQVVQNAHLNIDYEMSSGWSLNSVTAWDKTKTATISDFNFRDASQLPNRFYISATATPLLPQYTMHRALSQSIVYDFSQEVRVTTPPDRALRGTLGANYLRIHNPRSALNGYGVQGSVQNNSVKALSKTPAVFGAVYYDVAEDITLTAEGRYQWDEINSQGLFPIPAPNSKFTYTSFSPRVSIDYKFADNSLVYALFSRGYRPGGFNTALIANIPSVVAQLASAGAKLAYDEEQLDNYEVGIKATWLNGRLQTIVDAYWDKWVNGQVNQSIFVTLPGGGFASSGVILNTGRVKLSGVEAEARFAATENLLLAGSVAYMDNIIRNFADFSNGPRVYGSTNANGYRLPGAPKWTYSASAQYTDALFGDWNWFTRGDVTYRDGMFLDTHNIAKTAPVIRLNLRAGVETELLRIEAYVNNALNNREISEAGVSMDVIGQNVTQNAIRIVAPVKRVVGLKASYDF